MGTQKCPKIMGKIWPSGATDFDVTNSGEDFQNLQKVPFVNLAVEFLSFIYLPNVWAIWLSKSLTAYLGKSVVTITRMLEGCT